MIVDLKPSGIGYMEDLYKAGGSIRIFNELKDFLGKLNIAACFIGLSDVAEVTGIAYFLSKSTFDGFILTPIFSRSSLKSEDCIPPPVGGRLGS